MAISTASRASSSARRPDPGRRAPARAPGATTPAARRRPPSRARHTVARAVGRLASRPAIRSRPARGSPRSTRARRARPSAPGSAGPAFRCRSARSRSPASMATNTSGCETAASRVGPNPASVAADSSRSAKATSNSPRIACRLASGWSASASAHGSFFRIARISRQRTIAVSTGVGPTAMDAASHPTASENIRSSPACSASSAARRQARSASPDWHLIHQSSARTCQSCARPRVVFRRVERLLQPFSLPAHEPCDGIRIDLKPRRQPGNLRSGLRGPSPASTASARASRSAASDSRNRPCSRWTPPRSMRSAARSGSVLGRSATARSRRFEAPPRSPAESARRPASLRCPDARAASSWWRSSPARPSWDRYSWACSRW